MPPRHPTKNHDITAGHRLDLHTEHFVATYRATRSVKELHGYIKEGVPMPAYAYKTGPTTGLSFNEDQVGILNALNLSHEKACELLTLGRYSPEDSYNHYESMLASWNSLIEELGQPMLTDKPLRWHPYDLELIERVARQSIATVVYALARHERQARLVTIT